MDTIKIGKFLKSLRNEKNLTQEQLGEIIGSTNKTISRWENGNYLPPVEMLVELSKFYDVELNEILSGQRLDDENFKNKAEENLKTVLKESSFSTDDKVKFFTKKWKKDHAFELLIEMIGILALLIIGVIIKSEYVFLIIILGFVWSILMYNRMMAYVENHAYGKKNK